MNNTTNIKVNVNELELDISYIDGESGILVNSYNYEGNAGGFAVLYTNGAVELVQIPLEHRREDYLEISADKAVNKLTDVVDFVNAVKLLRIKFGLCGFNIKDFMAIHNE